MSRKFLPMRLEAICYKTCARWFAMLQDTQYQGAKFTWENFPNLAANQCAIQCALDMDEKLSEDTKKRYIKQIKQLGKAFSFDLVKSANLV